ncbi:hypothetical protein DL546_000942 [Coniochaeta pulveracea]|uniref:Uncharacterized protein n=1 Tax=Coniochaeta pulveracea TaxID=177199 RepID=A0A420Y560_9PEZI|nr:hypothetical protein DL546_000942 [Coniochaeta pulveracea]
MTTEAAQATSYTRLHITPLDSGLLPVVLSTSLLPKARNISYHSITTFPEKRYGFLDLPDEDAAKLKKKLNGALLKGHKLKVDVAKPQKIPEPLGEAAMMGEENVSKKKEKKSVKEDKPKKRKRAAEEIPGLELHDGRKVKRGWTVADEPKLRKDKKDKSKKGDKKEKRREVRSKYTDHPECLVKTIIPAKTVEEVDEDGKTKRKKSKAKQVTVHEFAKTTKFPTFLKTTTSSSTDQKELEFVDGKGWVDEEGNVVEAVKTRPQPVKPTRVPKVQKQETSAASQEQPSVTTQEVDIPQGSASEADEESDASNNSESEAEGEVEKEPTSDGIEAEKKQSPAPDTPTKNTMSPPPKPTIATPTVTIPQSPRPTSSSPSSAKGLHIKIPPPPATPGKTEVHPLEALYKRNKPADATDAAESEAQPFSFFGGADIEEDDNPSGSLQIPMTPFSRADFENRGIRSAAPTPDTAHPNRSFKPWAPDDIDEEDEGEDDDVEAGPEDTEMLDDDGEEEDAATGGPAAGTDESTSDFQKWFWEHRGDLNRSWKRRRKTAAKEKRYRENRARAERAI